MYTDSEVKPTGFEKRLVEKKQDVLNKATMMGSTDCSTFLMKSLWLLSSGKKQNKLRELA